MTLAVVPFARAEPACASITCVNCCPFSRSETFVAADVVPAKNVTQAVLTAATVAAAAAEPVGVAAADVAAVAADGDVDPPPTADEPPHPARVTANSANRARPAVVTVLSASLVRQLDSAHELLRPQVQSVLDDVQCSVDLGDEV